MADRGECRRRGQIQFDGVNLDVTEFDENDVLGNQSIPQAGWIDGSSLIRLVTPTTPPST